MSFKLKLSYLRAWQAVMLTGSITAASERLHITQPSISKQIAALEEVVGFKLFDRRSGGRLVPTAIGLRFYRQAEGMLAGLEQLPVLAEDLLKLGQSRLRVGATPPLMNSALLSQSLADLKKTFPSVRFSIESRPRKDIEEWVANGQIDIGLALLPVENPLIEAIPLKNTFVVAVMNCDHDHKNEAYLSPEKIGNENLIIPYGQLLRILIERSATSAGYSLEAFIETSSALTGCKLASEGLGIALCDPFSPTAFSRDSIIVKEWRPEVPLSYGILLRRDAERSIHVHELMNALQRRANEM
ncbi:LysR family transcriptional regulator [Pantoea sp. ME81]|uniref:LysR family transcriptional regulator n=1 Tax=Pantoea sp. ME81 TaxID=2743935 RepID=UPI0015F5F33D|nr:LysR family transcriptional regulator [Pantoea sp. ME81]